MMVARIATSLAVAGIAYAGGYQAVLWLLVHHYGREAFRNDAGAGFAVVVMALWAAGPVAIAAFFVTYRSLPRLRSKPRTQSVLHNPGGSH